MLPRVNSSVSTSLDLVNWLVLISKPTFWKRRVSSPNNLWNAPTTSSTRWCLAPSPDLKVYFMGFHHTRRFSPGDIEHFTWHFNLHKRTKKLTRVFVFDDRKHPQRKFSIFNPPLWSFISLLPFSFCTSFFVFKFYLSSPCPYPKTKPCFPTTSWITTLYPRVKPQSLESMTARKWNSPM